jgi:hypothetical protein
MNRVFLFPPIFVLLSLTGFGQDPTKVAPDAYKIGFENEYVKVIFENAQIRVARLACAKTCELPAGAEPALLVALSPLRLKSSGGGGGLEPGKKKWVEAGKKETVDNTGHAHTEFLRFDFKTKPIKGDGREATHAHPHD